MNGISTFWIVVYLCSTVLFFATAAVITVVGVKDLKDLLKKSEKTGE